MLLLSLVIYCWCGFQQLEGLYYKIYFLSDSITPGSLALMHDILLFAIRDYITENDRGFFVSERPVVFKSIYAKQP